MPAKHQSNKTRKTKNKKPQKRGQKAGKKQSRLQPKKQKKRQAMKAGSRTVLSISSPRVFATKILRLMPKVRMETKARGLMKSLLMDVYDQVLKEIVNRSQDKQPPAIEPSEVQEVFKEVMATELAKHSTESTSSETIGSGGSPEAAAA